MGFMKQSDPQFKLRLPAKLKQALEEATVTNDRTLTAEIVDRLETSFRSVPADDAAGLQLEAVRLKEKVQDLERALDAQDITIVMLRAYLIDVINSLPPKLRTTSQVEVAARFALDMEDDTEPVQPLLDLPSGVSKEPSRRGQKRRAE